MKNSWILDVLADLKDFASANGMTTLAEQLETTRHVARQEVDRLPRLDDRDPPGPARH